MSQAPILIALGANLPSEAGGPRDTLEAALRGLESAGVLTLKRSRWFRPRPEPPSDQAWYVNGVAAVATTLDPGALLALLHRIEGSFGRVRSVANAARPLDLDLLAYGDRVQRPPPGAGPILPHPRMAERAFVLLPLAEVAPGWRHPVSGRTVEQLIQGLGDLAGIRPLD